MATPDRREAALALVRRYVPSTYGDQRFAELLNGSWAPGFGTTCGYLTSWLLWRLGCTDGRIVNRNDPSRGLVYANGANMSKIQYGAQAIGAWRETGLPKPGDLYMVWKQPPPGSNDWRNHVGVVMDVSDNGATWHTADAGQGSAVAQFADFRVRKFDAARRLLDVSGEWRNVGFVDLDAVPLDLGNPPLPLPGDGGDLVAEGKGSGGSSGGRASGAARVGGGLALLALAVGAGYLATRA